MNQWEIDFFSLGECSTCCYSCFCVPCALADARHILDGSDWGVNCCCLNPSALRWMMRTAYNIEGSAQQDCWLGTFCSCCAANQMLQTAKKKGKADAGQVGPEFNVNDRRGFASRSCNGTTYDCLYSCLCMPCAIGYAMRSTGMPFWFGVCCVKPFTANTILRYQNRTKPYCGDESIPDCILPCLLTLVIGVLFGGAGTVATVWMYTFGNLVEENVRSRRRDCCYGCDCLTFCAYCCGYFTGGCTCTEAETGRYLHDTFEIPTASTGLASSMYN